MELKKITVETEINAGLEKVWEFWTKPEHIINWYFADVSWHCPKAINDLKIDGKFNFRMEAKDGSAGFDFDGIYTNIEENENHKKIEYEFGDRKAQIEFISQGESTKIVEIFDPENENPVEMQQQGWQGILNNFKEYVEKN